MIKKRHTPKQKNSRTNNLLWEACKKEVMGRSRKFSADMLIKTQRLYKEQGGTSA